MKTRVIVKLMPFMMWFLPSASSLLLKTFFVNNRVLSLLERKKLVSRAGRAMVNGGPFLAQLNITNACNQKCPMCNLWHNGQTMSFCDVQKAIINIEKMGAVLLTLTGGEPTLHPQFAEAIRLAAEKEFLVNINTNGSIPRLYQKLPLHLLDIVTISFHSLKDEVYKKITGANTTVEDVIKTVKIFKETSDAHIILKFVVQNDNIDEADDIMEFANDMGITVECDPVMVGAYNRPVASDRKDLNPDTGKLVQILKKIKRIKKGRGKSLIPIGYYDFCCRGLEINSFKWKCDAGIGYFSVYSDGRFGICKDVYTDEKITDDGFVNRWKSRGFKKKMDDLRLKCSGCNWSCYHTVSAFSSLLSGLSIENLQIMDSL